MSKKIKRNKLTPAAQKIVELIETIGGGSQRKFAAMTGCSQSVLSRVANGQQEPGRELIERIAKLAGVDGKSLLDSRDQATHHDLTDDFLVPIVTSLLRSAPEPNQLSASTLAVSRAIYRPTLYAVPARACEPACSDPAERLRPDDLIVVESSTTRFRQNLMMLNGKLCAVIVNEEETETITLRRVWVEFDLHREKRAILTCPDAKVKKLFDKKYRKYPRFIQLDLPENPPESDYVDTEISVTAIVGIAVQVIRTL